MNKVFWWILQKNTFFPLDPAYQNWGHRFLVLSTITTIIAFMFLKEVSDPHADSLRLASEMTDPDFLGAPGSVHFDDLSRRYVRYHERVRPDAEMELPPGRYPIFAVILARWTGKLRLPSANFYERLVHLRKHSGNGILIKDIHGNVLREKPNTRQYVPAAQIPDNLRQAFIFAEDKNFYVNIGGINPFRLLHATFYHVLFGSDKGNSSISEQVFKFYFGYESRNARDKWYQVLGSLYITYFSDDRSDIIDLYLQSVPGSYWGGHIRGVASISRLYLGEDNLASLDVIEYAWLSRIGLRPNEHGSMFANYWIVSRYLLKQGIDLGQLDVLYGKDRVTGRLASQSFDFSENPELEHKLIAFLDDEESNLWLRRAKLKEEIPKTIPHRQLFRWLVRLRGAYLETTRRLGLVLGDFRRGSFLHPPLLSSQDLSLFYERLRHGKGIFAFLSPALINRFQSYTDQSLKDLDRILGRWARDAGLEVVTAFDQEMQEVLDRELIRSVGDAQDDRLPDEAEQVYGGASVLLRTHRLSDRQIENKIVALSSVHPKDGSYFNWAVDGKRSFGSIYKWLILLQYLEEGGTLLDRHYDIPRTFNISKSEIYRPDNWFLTSEDYYGYYTLKSEDMVYNFLQSKNVTFVRIAELLGPYYVSRFLNRLSDYDLFYPLWDQFQPHLSLPLGTMDTSPIMFAQMLSVIPNQGKSRPVTTIEYIRDPIGNQYALDELLPTKQIVTRESAEGAFWNGYLNTYGGTARRFFQGGVAKTGSSLRDACFVTMTARLPHQRIDDAPGHLLNSNLLYLVSIGTNEGRVYRNLYGGRLGAKNAHRVFQNILDYNPDDGSTRHAVAASPDEILKTFSPDFEYHPYDRIAKLGPTKIPILKDREIYKEPHYDYQDLANMATAYLTFKSLEYRATHEKQPPLLYDREGNIRESTLEDYAQHGSQDFVESAYQNFCHDFPDFEECSWMSPDDDFEDDLGIDPHRYVPRSWLHQSRMLQRLEEMDAAHKPDISEDLLEDRLEKKLEEKLETRLEGQLGGDFGDLQDE